MKYIHISNNYTINTNSIIGFFDLDTSTMKKSTKDFLNTNEKNKKIINTSLNLPKSFIVCKEDCDKIYLSQLSTQTLKERILI